MQRDLSNRTVLLVDGGGGLGRGVALSLARAGAAVAIAGATPSGAEAVASEIRSLGRRSMALTVDATERLSVQRCLDQVLDRLTQIDILVSVIGPFQHRLGLELDGEEFNDCLQANLTRIWCMVRQVVPHFRSQGGGRIVNVVSTAGRQGVAGASAYCVASAGMISLSQSLAVLLGTDNINVNSICVGPMSVMLQSEFAASGATQAASRARSGALAGAPAAEDVGHAVVFLASDYAKNITGQALNVDCGQLMN